MNYNLGIFSFLTTYRFVKCALDPYITGGSFTKYDQYPHSVLLSINSGLDNFICGGSVLNQALILTAGHCVEDCGEHDTIDVKYGHEIITKMKTIPMDKFVLHEEYDEVALNNDIALILTKERIPLNNIVKRVILMTSPPGTQVAYVAGWGADESTNLPPELKHTSAYIQKYEICVLGLGQMPDGVFCAGPLTGLGAANLGDSGSALVVDEYVQIGIVSYKTMELALVAYTNVSYFLDWIQANSKDLSCADYDKE